MLEEIKIFKNVLKENKLKILIILIISIIFGAAYNHFHKPTFSAKFEMAPYFEIASEIF